MPLLPRRDAWRHGWYDGDLCGWPQGAEAAELAARIWEIGVIRIIYAKKYFGQEDVIWKVV
jgi:hypothetical protein